MHKLKAFCLGLGLALMPFITLLMCGVVGQGWLNHAIFFWCCLSVVLLGESFLPLVKIISIARLVRAGLGVA
ncbi:hypothetical protein [Helicobacter labacensis]|uniref:hypothetical protein n=1 Tax=Helicobacter labacensis TaxID=2316079 RepID=UPI001F474DCA|nr:hypothetical protein [Helicobacter labacensis]